MPEQAFTMYFCDDEIDTDELRTFLTDLVNELDGVNYVNLRVLDPINRGSFMETKVRLTIETVYSPVSIRAKLLQEGVFAHPAYQGDSLAFAGDSTEWTDAPELA